MGKKITQRQLDKYKILTCLEDGPKYSKEVKELTQIHPMELMKKLSAMIRHYDIKKLTDKENIRYKITYKGRDKMIYFRDRLNAEDYWTPPWKEKLVEE
jgi:predicted transcriptional regulator